MKRIPTLDGWRGIAITLVLFDHVQSALLRGYLRPWTGTGQHGVTIFFVLSGFLITTKLMEGPRDLKRFYIRRFFRLMPAAWAYVAALWVFDTLLCGHRYITPGEIASCVFFFRNYVGHNLSMAAAHFWSLSLEEQFYTVWPLLLGFLGIRRCRWIAVAGIAACTLWRSTHWVHYDRLWYNFHTEVRADALLVGCLLAMAMSDPRVCKAAKQYARWWSLPTVVTFVYCVARFQQLPPLIEPLSIAGMIAGTVGNARLPLARWLEWRPLAWLGAVSYSVYVWQQFFVLQFPRVVSIELMCFMPFFAIASYYWIERPATRIGHWITSEKRSSQMSAEAAMLRAQ